MLSLSPTSPLLFKLIFTSPNLHSLHISDNGFGNDGAEIIATFAEELLASSQPLEGPSSIHTPALRDIVLTDNLMSPTGSARLLRSISRWGWLTSVGIIGLDACVIHAL